MLDNQDVAILNRLGKLQNSVDETANVVIATSKESTSQEILATVKNSGGGGLLPVYVTGDSTPAHYEWSMSGCTPYAFQYGASVVYKDELHILGGCGNHFGHWKWDGENWLNVSILPYKFLNGTAVVYKDAIHILGGDGDMSGHYQWSGQEWVQEVSSFQAITKASAVVYNNEIHVLQRSVHMVFNGTQWYQVSNKDVGDYCKAVVYDGAVHLFSSYYHYKWDGSSWTTLNNTEYTVSGDTVVFNNQIHIFCGTQHYIWNKTTDTWTKKNNVVQSEFNDGKVIVYKNQLHLLGGSATSQNHFVWDASSDTYTGVKSLPKCFSNGVAVLHDGEIHLFGADDDTYGHYKWNGTTLTYVSKMPYPVSKTSDLYVVEYENEFHLLYSSLHYKYKDNTWVSLASTSATRSLKYCFVMNNTLYLKRGTKSSDDYCDRWNPDTDTWAYESLSADIFSKYRPRVHIGTRIYVFDSYEYSSDTTYCYLKYYNGSSWSSSKVCETSIQDGGVNPTGGVAYTDNGVIYLLKNNQRYKLQGSSLVYVDTLPFNVDSNSFAGIYNGTTTVLCGANAQSNITQLVPVKPTYRAYSYILPKGTQIIGTSSMIPLSGNLKTINETTLQVTETGEVALLVGNTVDDRKLIIKG